jgi:hypothetical protein
LKAAEEENTKNATGVNAITLSVKDEVNHDEVENC